MKFIVVSILCFLVAFTVASEKSIQLDVFSGSNQYWLAVAVRDASVGTRSVHIKEAGSLSWRVMKLDRESGYYTLSSTNVLDFPFSLMLTSVSGEKITFDSIITSSFMGTVSTNVNYYVHSISARRRKGKATKAPTLAPNTPTSAPNTPTSAPDEEDTPKATSVPTKSSSTPTKAPATESGCSAPIKLMVPLYSYPGAAWDTVAASGKVVPTMAIINPSSGPGNGPDSAFNKYMDKLNNAGVEMVGYVHTSYGTRSISTVKAEIDIYATQFPLVVGVFLDEVAATADKLSYYAELYTYIMSMPGWKYDVINPGAVTVEGYVNVATQIVSFEDTSSKFSASSNPSFAECSNKDKFSVITYGASSTGMQAAVDTARDKGYYGWVYVTDGAGGCCTYNTIASYYSSMATYIASTN